MNNQRDFGILTFYKEKNYGAALQAFSLQKKIQELGYSSEFINWNDSLNKTEKHLSLLRTLISIIKNYGIDYRKYCQVREKNSETTGRFDKFVNEYMTESKTAMYDKDDLISISNNYKGFIAGSDMVWTDIGQDLDAYFMQFAAKEKRGSYAPSLTGTCNISEEKLEKISKLIKSIEYLSFREEEGATFARDYCSSTAQVVVDPTLLHTKEDWCKLFGIENLKKSKPYILCYMFGGVSASINKRIHKLAKKRGWEVRYIPMTPNETISEIKQGHCGSYGPFEFVEMFINSSFVITNSYHGFLFSLISNVPFVVFRREKNNRWKQNEERISFLLNQIGEEKRYLALSARLDEKYTLIDYSYINDVIKRLREHSTTYLNNMLKSMSNNEIIKPLKKTTVSLILNKECVECNNCKSICPQKAITMTKNSEGFTNPVVDDAKCVNCSLCTRVCPAIKSCSLRYPQKTIFGFSNYREQIRSSSGGAFYHIARKMIENHNAYIYGAAFDDNNLVNHIEVHCVEDLSKIQGSKYVKSNLNNTYQIIKDRLEQGDWVLFSGTPCQVAGLYLFLNTEYSRLLTIDLVCHGVPSEDLWKSYIDFLSNGEPVKDITFRNKDNESAFRSAFEIKAIIGKRVRKEPAYKNPFYKLYIENKIFRMSCYYCRYASKERCGDITVGDCDSWKNQTQFFPEKAKSIVLLNSEKACNLSEDLLDKFEYTDLDYNTETMINTTLSKPTSMPMERKMIYTTLLSDGWGEYAINDSVLKKIFRKNGGIKNNGQ